MRILLIIEILIIVEIALEVPSYVIFHSLFEEEFLESIPLHDFPVNS